MTRTEKSYIKLFMSIFTRENSFLPAQGFFAGTLPSLLLDTIDTLESSFFTSLVFSTSKQN